MAVEQPAIAAVITRLPDSEVQLAAYGSVVFPIALLIEAPIIMLLSASTELSRDLPSYALLRRVTNGLGFALTLLHVLLGVTPLGDWVMGSVLEVPQQVAAAAKPGLLLIVPWTWAIAARRLGQGVLIRFGYARAVGVGTFVRLMAAASVLAWGLADATVASVKVGAAALSVGVLAEAGFVAFRVRQVVHSKLASEHLGERLTFARFVRFYVPLALTPIILLAIQPVGTAAISRMPQALHSLDVWPVVIGLGFMVQSLGVAFQEVVVAHAGLPGAWVVLRRFAWGLAVVPTATWMLFASTPLSAQWFVHVAGLSQPLVEMAMLGTLIAAPLPATRALQSWYQGRLVVARRTMPITEAVVVFAIACSATLMWGVLRQGMPGVYVALAAFVFGRVLQTVWLAWRV